MAANVVTVGVLLFGSKAGIITPREARHGDTQTAEGVKKNPAIPG